MKPTFELHKLKEGFIVTSDEKPEIGELYIDDTNLIRRSVMGSGTYWDNRNSYRKVIAQQDQIDFSALTEEEQKEIGWFDYAVEFANEIKDDGLDYNTGRWYGRIEGFQKAQELLSDRRFTLEDMRKAFNAGDNYRYYENGGFRSIPSDVLDEEQYMQSLSQPKSWKIEIETYCGTQDCILFGCQKYEGCKHNDLQQAKLTNGKIKILKLL